MIRSRIAALTAASTLLVSGAFAANAGAVFHEYRISEIHQGTGATGDFVELQAFSAGQNLVGGHYVIVYDGGNTAMDEFQFPSNVANTASQATILVANDASVTGADFIAPGGLNVVNTNGAACFVNTTTPLAGVDCVDWGTPIGGSPPLPSPAGTPISGGLLDNQSFSRNITRGCATALDTLDDNENSSADFALATPSPRPNSATPTETLCSTPKKKKKKCKKKKKKGKGKYGAGAAKKKKCKKKKKK